MRSTSNFHVGQVVRFVDHRAGRLTITFLDDDPTLPILVQQTMDQSMWVSPDEIEAIPDDPSPANFIVLPKTIARRMMTRDEAEVLVSELTVPAFIAQIVSEHRAVH